MKLLLTQKEVYASDYDPRRTAAERRWERVSHGVPLAHAPRHCVSWNHAEEIDLLRHASAGDNSPGWCFLTKMHGRTETGLKQRLERLLSVNLPLPKPKVARLCREKLSQWALGDDPALKEFLEPWPFHGPCSRPVEPKPDRRMLLLLGGLT